MRTLILYSSYLGTKRAAYYDDWLEAFQSCPYFEIASHNIVPPQLKVANPSKYKDPEGLALKRRLNTYQFLYEIYSLGYVRLLRFLTQKELLWNLSEIPLYDLIVLLHSTNADSVLPLSLLAPYLRNRKGKLLIFVGNEYCVMPEKIRFIKDVEADFVASQLPSEAALWLYSDCAKTRVLTIPHALNLRVYQCYRENSLRKTDIGFIGDKYTYGIGDVERTRVAEYFSQNGFQSDLVRDIRMGRKLRLTRKLYVDFLNSIRCTIGAESGTYYLEKTDSTQKKVEAFLSLYPKATFEAVFERFFKGYPDPVNGKAVSSRHFESIGTKTCQVLLEGYYNGILKPDVHYVCLKKDYSNIQDVIERIKDRGYVQKLVDSTYEYAAEGHTYSHRVLDVWKAVS
jgi:hypothetical protein